MKSRVRVDYLAALMDRINEGQIVQVCQIKAAMNKEGDGITSLTLQYRVPNEPSQPNLILESDNGLPFELAEAPIQSWPLASDDYIVSMSGTHTETRITRLCFRSNQGQLLELGKEIGTRFELPIPAGKRVIGFAGEYGSCLCNIGVYYI